MRPSVLFLVATVATASPTWWFFDAWDGLSCGDAPQNGDLLLTKEGIDEMTCYNFDEGQKAYSYATEFGDDDLEGWGYLQEHCEGPRKALKNHTCMNPDMDIPYIRSWKIYNIET